jgi:hypothetical protein
MTQGTSASIAYGHIAFYFDGWDFVYEFECVGAVFSKFVLSSVVEVMLAFKM